MVHNGRAYEPQHLPPKNTLAALGGGGGESERGTRSVRFRPSSTAMIRDPKPLHNFTLPLLGWGCQKLMRSVREDDPSMSMSPLSSSLMSEGGRRSSVLLPCDRAKFEEEEEDGEGIEAVRAKLMSDLRTETDKLKELLKGDDKNTEEEEEPAGKLARAAATARRQEEEEAAETRPWNLRTRRAVCKSQAVSNGSPARRLAAASPETKREKFSVTLKRKEIEEDFMRLIGRLPHRRPTKRRNAVQKQLDMVFPGLWLTEVTADTYKVVEVPDKGKR